MNDGRTALTGRVVGLEAAQGDPQVVNGREWRAIVERAGFELAAVHSDRGPAILKNRRPLRVLLRLVVRLLTYFPPLRYQHVLVLRAR